MVPVALKYNNFTAPWACTSAPPNAPVIRASKRMKDTNFDRDRRLLDDGREYAGTMVSPLESVVVPMAIFVRIAADRWFVFWFVCSIRWPGSSQAPRRPRAAKPHRYPRPHLRLIGPVVGTGPISRDACGVIRQQEMLLSFSRRFSPALALQQPFTGCWSDAVSPATPLHLHAPKPAYRITSRADRSGRTSAYPSDPGSHPSSTRRWQRERVGRGRIWL